ncbi:thioredoxin domain-containing protein [Pullulanibacillus sp. KACC 23026]|uniref:thioredoxin domain-containing protein n=1 Tax=Pullulanibacillus sp. KACC 23026 TaxID=3028315 RepID=UPI0023AE8B16|nr:thioredoxin domain-containing protein [Pullulanibacillus sp. KACC 23026]WEG10780.1 thioredoxin domain-containing protein [Pullulanibacillus sp. KACC 23026]
MVKDKKNPRYTNRLINEKSPYLLQHAHNPVDWYAWGEEAFAKAKAENKPVFVSIGYSTCHWCHVMAHESFEDEEIASLLNERFISIKVDREERPDIDSVYMNVCQALTGHGGWPLSVFLTPDQKPFYAGTYWPKESRYGQLGFRDVILSLSDHYQETPEKIEGTGDQIIAALKKAGEEAASIHPHILEQTYEHFKSTFDPEYGGFGQEPKFPSPHQLMWLMRYAQISKEPEALQMVEKTLESLAKGGIHDHIGGGFSRYSVDREWLVPHFEKMLYDQATLMIAYSEAYKITKNPAYADSVDDIFQYVTRELTDEKGGFYSAEDADSEGVEGKFYVWHPEEVIEVLGDEEGAFYCDVYDITKNGNFEGASIPHLIGVSLDEEAERYQISVTDFVARLENAREKLFLHREKRIHPHKDDKVLTSWNGMMIAALATAYQATQNKDYLQAAERAFNFLNEHLWVNGKWKARYRQGDVKYDGYLDDYAMMLWACDALYESTFNSVYLTHMEEWAKGMIQDFWDEKGHGFFLTAKSTELFIRPKDIYDGATPSGNSVASLMLLKLSRRTGNLDFEMYVDKMFNRFGAEVNRYPMGHTFFLMTYLLAKQGTKELVVLTPQNEAAQPEFKGIQTEFCPEIIPLVGTHKELISVAALTQTFYLMDDKTTYYLCKNYACERPTTDWEQVLKEIR